MSKNDLSGRQFLKIYLIKMFILTSPIYCHLLTYFYMQQVRAVISGHIGI